MAYIHMSGPSGLPYIIDDQNNYPESSAEMIWAELRYTLGTEQRGWLDKTLTSTILDQQSARGIRDYVKNEFGGKSSVADFGRLKMKDFRTMLQYVDWVQDNTASKIVLGRLWMGDYQSKPQFSLLVDLPAEFSLRLNGHALHLPETDLATCEHYDVDSILPSHFAALRYKPDTPGVPPATFCLFVLGDVLARRDFSDPWESTGLLLAANLIKLDSTAPPSLFLIYNSTDEDVNRGKLEIFGQDYDATLLKIETDRLLHLLQIEGNDSTPEAGITIMSKERLEFFELGVREDVSGENVPVSLIPVPKQPHD